MVRQVTARTLGSDDDNEVIRVLTSHLADPAFIPSPIRILPMLNSWGPPRGSLTGARQGVPAHVVCSYSPPHGHP